MRILATLMMHSIILTAQDSWAENCQWNLPVETEKVRFIVVLQKYESLKCVDIFDLNRIDVHVLKSRYVHLCYSTITDEES